jgi:hypothetical protein
VPDGQDQYDPDAPAYPQDGWIFVSTLEFDSPATAEAGHEVGHAEIVDSDENEATVAAAVVTSSVTDNSSVNALAVNTARTNYLAATGVTLDGTGLKIGIMSDSFNLSGGEATDIANGDLPSASNIHILKEGASGNDEGRAMAELIHQIAPNAQIYFYTATSSESDFATGISTLVSAGVNVIVDDVTYTDESFYQDTGAVTQAVEAAIASGVDYFTSANNSSNNFYEAVFNPLSFALPGIGTKVTNNVGNGTPYEAVTLGTNASLDFTVQWTEPYNNSRYDIGVGLYSYNSSNNSYTLVRNFTTTALSGTALLSFQGQITDTAGTYYLAFYESASQLVGGQAITPGTFKIVFFQDSNAVVNGIGAGIGSGTSIGHELVPAANTVAAVNVANTPSNGVSTPVVDSYSAYGPGVTYFDANGNRLATPVSTGTPDFAATDGTPTSVFNPFNGTSAAAPNAAAVSLLVLQADGRLTTVQITTLLDRSAIPTASTLNGGAGLIQADTAVAIATTAAATPIWTAQAGTTLWSVAANWSDNAAPGSASPVQISDGLGLFTAAYAVAFDVASASVASLVVDGGTYLAALPTLNVRTSDVLTTGSLTLGRGTIDISGRLADSGSLILGSAAGAIIVESLGRLSIAGGTAASTIAFAGVGGSVVFSTSSAATLTTGLAATLAGFTVGDLLDLSGLAVAAVAAVHVVGSAVTVVNSVGQTLAALTITGLSGGLGFGNDGSGGTVLVACYLQGTRIATPDGETPIEDLRIGDLVRTASGATRPIRWIGWRGYSAARAAGDRELQPIRFPAGSLGPNSPCRDLYVSPRHAMLLGGVLVPANRLLGWQGIARAALRTEIVYLHIELDTHDLILANGAASESFADTGNRHMFHNGGDYAALYPDDVRSAWQFCAPRLADRVAARGAL